MDPDFEWATYAQKLRVVAYWWNQQQAVCCICNDRDLLMDEYHRDADRNPLAASLEHLIPKRDGGVNTVGNVRLAHRMCNGALGGLYSHNEERAANFLEPRSIAWALDKARRQWAELIRRRQAGLPYMDLIYSTPTKTNPLGDVRSPFERSPRVQFSLAKAVQRSGGRIMSLPRGATLPGYTEEPMPPASLVSGRERAPLMAPRPAKDLLERKAKPGRRQVRPVCIACGSTKVTMDASLKWSVDLQAWMIGEKRDTFDCAGCQADAAIKWETIP